MSRPCRWPDGGCGADIIDVTTAKGAKQVLDVAWTKAIVLVHDTNEPCNCDPDDVGQHHWSRVVNTYVDHHATCPKWAAKVERERAAKAARP